MAWDKASTVARTRIESNSLKVVTTTKNCDASKVECHYGKFPKWGPYYIISPECRTLPVFGIPAMVPIIPPELWVRTAQFIPSSVLYSVNPVFLDLALNDRYSDII